ncbi:MAG: RND transporter, partial [Methylophilaceae bacterium]|nr:RND transporter [Methylophilaceae bacterium]
MKLKQLIRLFVALPALSLVACQMIGPDYFRPKQALPTSFQEAQATDAAAAISNQWWTLYNDEVLNDLIAKASKNNT